MNNSVLVYKTKTTQGTTIHYYMGRFKIGDTECYKIEMRCLLKEPDTAVGWIVFDEVYKTRFGLYIGLSRIGFKAETLFALSEMAELLLDPDCPSGILKLIKQ